MPLYRKLYVKTVESLDVNDMPDDFCRLMWVLLPLALCQAGRGIDSAAWIKAKLFPLRLDVTLPVIQAALDWFAARGMIRRYQVEGRPYFYVPTWHRYQGDTSREAKTNYPPPPDEGCPEEHGRPEERTARPAGRRSRVTHELAKSTSESLCMSNSSTDADANANADAEAEAEADAGGEGGPMGLGAAAPPSPPSQPKTEEGTTHRRTRRQRTLPRPPQLETPPSEVQTPRRGVSTFQAWLDRIQEAEDRPAVLREMFATLYPGRDLPTLAKLGAFALKVGGASRLAELMWKCSVRPPTGDVLAYLYGVHRHNGPALAYRDERDLRDLDGLIHH